MVDSAAGTTSNTSLINSLNAGATGAKSVAGKNTEGIGKTEFLTMLVTQLKNQDPLDPMKNEDFAVNLAQFSSLEQLISINGKVGAPGNSPSEGLSSYASFLGREVSVPSDELTVADNDGGSISFTLPEDAKSSRVDIMRPDGSIAKSADGGTLAAGRHDIGMSDLNLPDGTYTVKVTAYNNAGQASSPETDVGGIVTGLIPGDEPVLLIGAREVKVSDISLVKVAS